MTDKPLTDAELQGIYRRSHDFYLYLNVEYAKASAADVPRLLAEVRRRIFTQFVLERRLAELGVRCATRDAELERLRAELAKLRAVADAVRELCAAFVCVDDGGKVVDRASFVRHCIHVLPKLRDALAALEGER